MMRRISENEYHKYILWAKATTANRVYPCSIAEGFQSGDIYVNDGGDTETVLFWHYCGFAYISGTVSKTVLDGMMDDVCRKSARRMLLITDHDFVIHYFVHRGKEIGKRVEYDYDCAGNTVKNYADIDNHADIDIRRIDSGNIGAITGKVIPGFSWKNSEFLKKGFGYAAFDHEKYAGVAFSAAISSENVDIGVEVDPAFRNRGIAAKLARKMCEETISQGKSPVWAHLESNAGSMRTAIRCGFAQKKINAAISLAGPGA